MKTITYDETQWKLVPVEPTETMVVSGFESAPDKHFSTAEEWERYEAMSGCQQSAYRAEKCWAAMLAAAPTPPAAGQAQQDADKVDALLAAGSALSNAAFNLAQRVGEPLTSEWCRSLDKARKAWDAARAQQGGQP